MCLKYLNIINYKKTWEKLQHLVGRWATEFLKTESFCCLAFTFTTTSTLLLVLNSFGFCLLWKLLLIIQKKLHYMHALQKLHLIKRSLTDFNIIFAYGLYLNTSSQRRENQATTIFSFMGVGGGGGVCQKIKNSYSFKNKIKW